jgi:hypothetical protein
LKALTLTQPFATLLAAGVIRVVTLPPGRDLGRGDAGELAIHAAARMPPFLRWWCVERLEFNRALLEAGCADPESLPLGKIVGVGQLAGARVLTPADGDLEAAARRCIPMPDRALVNLDPGRVAYCFSSARKLERPIAARGAPRLWTWTSPRGVEL